MHPIPKLSEVDVAFPANIEWIPPLSDIPAKYHRPQNTKAGRFFLSLFFRGIALDRLGMLPREGVVAEAAWRALVVCLTTFGIKHEHKEAAFAFLIDQWFRDIRWTEKDGTEVPFENAEFDAEWLAARER